MALDFDHILDGNRHTLKPAIIALDLYIHVHIQINQFSLLWSTQTVVPAELDVRRTTASMPLR